MSIQSETILIPLKKQGKRCIKCLRMWTKKNSDYCFRCDPNKIIPKYTLGSFNKLTTIRGIRKAYGNILNAVRKNTISRDEANTLFYGLKCFIGSLKEIIDMKQIIDKQEKDTKVLITDKRIDELKVVVDKMERLKEKFAQLNHPLPSGEIDSSVQDATKTPQLNNFLI